MNDTHTSGKTGGKYSSWLWALLPIVTILTLVFSRSFVSHQVQFSNDGPFGGMSADFSKMPEIMHGLWNDLYWVGQEQPSLSPSMTALTLLMGGALGFAKWYAPLSILFAAVCGAFFVRRIGGKAGALALVAIAAALNTNFFSYACWGLASRPFTLGALLLGVTALLSLRNGYWGIKIALTGFCVGLGLMESYDVGAIFSLYLAAFAAFITWIDRDKSTSAVIPKALGAATVRVALMALCAGFIAAQTISTLVATQVKGVAVLEEEKESPEQKWAWAVQWSLPKSETLRVLIPGLYGYRMDTPGGGAYWGAVGRDLSWKPGQQGLLRYSGAGEYAGLLVVLVSAWAVVQALRRKAVQPVFQERERKIILFWAVSAAVSLLLAFGHHAPFYKLIYPLPFFNTMRNAIKFTHLMHFSLLILFAYGLVGIARAYLERSEAAKNSAFEQFKKWWKTPGSTDKGLFLGLLAFTAASVLIGLLYVISDRELVKHLAIVGFPDDATAKAISAFSAKEVLWYLLFLGLSVCLAGLVMCGALTGKRAGLAAVLGVLLLGTDMVRANAPWVIYYDYTERLTSNPIFDILRDKPYEHRVQVFPYQVNENLMQLQQIYGSEWTQHQFPYFNIQTLDIVQEPRTASDNKAFRSIFRSAAQTVRKWELTNTRYLLGMGGDFYNALNQQFDPQKRRFRLHTAFTLAPKKEKVLQFGDITAVPLTNGPFGLIEFTGALPRTSLYSRWQVNTNDQAVLQTLGDLAFDPAATVLVSTPIPASTSTNPPGAVAITSYAPKRLELRATNAEPAVLLLNDKHHPAWKVWVDGQPASLLRCNFLMQGVYLDKPGQHTVELRFEPSARPFYTSLAGVGVALLLCALLAFLACPCRKAQEAIPAKG